MREGNDYVIGGEVYPTYEDALEASNREDTPIFSTNGDTASKVEGHTTLEEFKKAKEDRIKELEKKLSNLEKGNTKLNSNLSIFNQPQNKNFDSNNLKNDDLALMLFNQALGLNLASVDELTWDNIKDNIFFEKEDGTLGIKNLAFVGGNLLSTKKITLNDFINQKGLFPDYKIYIGESVIYPNVFETLEKNEIIKEAIFDNLFNLSGAFEQVKKELNNHSPDTFIIETPKGKFIFPKRFAAGFWNVSNKVELLLKENQSSYMQDYLANKRKREEVIKDGERVKPVITKTLTVNDTIVQNAIGLIGNSIIENAIKNNTSVKIQVFSNAEYSKDGIAGWYLPASNTIYLHESMLNPQHISEGLPLIAHELIHSVTEQALQFDKSFQKDIQSLLDSVKAQSKIKDFYGFKNTSEFLSEAFSSQEFRQLLKDTQFSSKEKISVWQKFINTILNLFGKVNKYNESTTVKNAEQTLNSIINQHSYKIGFVNSNITDKIYSNKEINSEIQSIKNEINQLKQELERVETEGFGALRPIYNFYENTVANILKKDYGKVEEEVKQNIKRLKEQLFYNLNKLDAKRKATNNTLNGILSRALSNLSVETIDENGVVTNKAIEVKSLEAFKNWYENNPKYKGEKFTQIGAALLLDGILAATKDDGVTFAEEHLHFIVEVIKDTPEVQELLTATNEYGFRLFETTQVYQDNYRKYTEQYKGQPDVKNKVDKEILAKLIAQYMYDKRAVNGIRNRLKRLLDRVIRIFYKSAKGWAKKLDDTMYPIEIRKALNLIDNNLEYNKYISDTKQHVIKYDPSKIEGVKANPSDNLTAISTQLENMKKRLDQIIKSSPVAGKDWTRYKELFNRTVVKSGEDNVSELSLERIAEFKKEVEKALALDPGNPELQQKIVDIQELEKLFNTFDKNRQDVFQLYNIEARISKINKSIALKQYEEGLNFFLFGTGNMKGASDPDTYDYNQYGAIFDLYKAFSKVIGFTGVPGENTVDSKNTLLSMVRPEHIAEMKELFDSYAPILHIVKNYYIENGNKLFDGDDVRNAKVAEALRLSNMYIDTIRDFIDNNEVHQHARNNIEIENFRFIGREDLISDITSKSGAKIYTDLSMMKKVMGLYQHASEAWLRKFQLKINSLEEKENELNYQDVNTLYNNLVALGYKALKGSKIREIFYQLDSRGNSTHYLNTERDVAKWNKDKTEFTKEIPKLLQNYVRNMGYSVYVPNTYQELMKIFTPIYTLKKEDKASLPKELTELWKVRDYYSELWGTWHENNTEEFTQKEADAFLAEAKNKLSLYHYKKLQESSIKEYTKLDGTTVTYFSGALTRPKAINANYFKLNKQERAMADLFVKTVSDKKLQDNPEKYTFEWLARAPQISATMMDTFTGGGKRKVIKDKLAGIFSPRIDDDFYNVDGQGNVIKLPPERYNKKLDDPKLLTNDIIRSFAIYSANINHRKVFIPELMELQGMVDMVSTGQVTTSPYAFSLRNSLTTKSGKGSTLESAMNNLMDTVVYKNTTDKTPYSTFLIAAKKYITSLNLAYNMPSFVTSWISGEIDKGVAAKIGDNYGTWEYMTGQKKYAKDLPSIMKDFESPTKRTVLGALSVVMGVGNSTLDNFSLTTTSKGIRMAISSVAPFSGWNATELLQSLPLFATSAETIRQIDGIWYTKPSYENKFFKIPVGTTNKKKFIEDQKKKWREGKSFMDTMKVDNGNITFQDVPENIVNLYFLRTRTIISEMSQQYTSDTYKGSLHTDSISNLLGTHSTWLMLTMDKMFGAKIHNYLTGQTQSGYYTSETLRYLKDTLLQGSRELYHSLKNSSLDVPTVKYMMNPDINFENRHNIRSVKRIGLHLGVIIAASAAMYIFAGLALGDEDDDELSVALQLASLLLMKVGIEQKAKLSVNDIYEIANNPLAHLEGSFKRFQVLDALWSVLSKNEEDWGAYTQDGPYKGMPKWSVSLAKSTPYFKGIFENYAAWYLNPMLGGSLTGDVSEQARSFRQKSAALKRYVVEPTTVGEVRNIAGDFPFALPAKIIGNTIGENALQIMGEPYYKNSSMFNMKLPSKKANKDEE
jgi:hypothetical protein